MNNIIFTLFLLAFSYADNSKYNQAMSHAIDLFKTAELKEDFLKASNYFYRISQAVDNDWLPGYYYALCNFKISLEEKDSFIKDEYLDKSMDLLSPYDSLDIYQIDSLALSEIYALKAIILSGKIMIDPMTRGQKYGVLSSQMIEQSISYSLENPRPYLVSGQMKFYTPAAFGGGEDKAMPLIKESLERFKNFSALKFWPDWGFNQAKLLYSQIEKQ